MEHNTTKLSSRSKRVNMKRLATVTLMLTFGVATVYAQPDPDRMMLSGSAAHSTIVLQGTPASEYTLSGNSELGQVDVRVFSISRPSTQEPVDCSGSNKVYGLAVAGGGVVRFQDGSLLKVVLTGGSDCVDLEVVQALCIREFRITGGTGRFKNVSDGAITLTMTLTPVFGDGPNTAPVFFAVTAAISGTVPGASEDQRVKTVR